MPVVGIVLTLSPDFVEKRQALAFLQSDPRFELGTLFGNRLPVVLDTPDAEADRAAWDDLRAQPGLLQMDVVFAALPDSTETPPVCP